MINGEDIILVWRSFCHFENKCR